MCTVDTSGGDGNFPTPTPSQPRGVEKPVWMLGPDTWHAGLASDHLSLSAALRRRIPGWGKLWGSSLLAFGSLETVKIKGRQGSQGWRRLRRWENPKTRKILRN